MRIVDRSRVLRGAGVAGVAALLVGGVAFAAPPTVPSAADSQVQAGSSSSEHGAGSELRLQLAGAAVQTPEPADIRDAAKTAQPTETPDATEMAKPSETPDATETPEATRTPEPTETPDATETPEATHAPEGTDHPEATAPAGDGSGDGSGAAGQNGD